MNAEKEIEKVEQESLTFWGNTQIQSHYKNLILRYKNSNIFPVMWEPKNMGGKGSTKSGRFGPINLFDDAEKRKKLGPQSDGEWSAKINNTSA